MKDENHDRKGNGSDSEHPHHEPRLARSGLEEGEADTEKTPSSGLSKQDIDDAREFALEDVPGQVGRGRDDGTAVIFQVVEPVPEHGRGEEEDADGEYREHNGDNGKDSGSFPHFHVLLPLTRIVSRIISIESDFNRGFAEIIKKSIFSIFCNKTNTSTYSLFWIFNMNNLTINLNMSTMNR